MKYWEISYQGNVADKYKVELEVSCMKTPKNAPEWVKQMYVYHDFLRQ